MRNVFYMQTHYQLQATSYRLQAQVLILSCLASQHIAIQSDRLLAFGSTMLPLYWA